MNQDYSVNMSVNMDDFDELMDYDSDEENDIQDLEQLNAVLANDQPCVSSSVSVANTCSSFPNYAEYSKVETALALNRMCCEKLLRLEGILQARLIECRRRLNEVQSFCEPSDRFDRQESFRYVYCGKPYFKDKQYFPAPDNEDTALMIKSQMYNFSGIASVPGWTVKDKHELTSLLENISRDKRRKELHAQISVIQRENKIHKTKENEKKIFVLRNQISTVSKLQIEDLTLPMDEEYDWDFVANKLSNRHSAQEYRALWKLFLHPSITKHVWTKAEHIALQKIAYEHRLQDWDLIASKLGSGRTNYQCFVYFRTNINNTFTSRKWTKDEEEYLKRLIEYYREDNYIPWGKVAATMNSRTKIQIYNKYSRLCELRKGKFLPEEDSVILTCIDHFGPNFKKVTEYLHGRSVTQVRDRFQVLAKKRYSAVWTVDEDRKLIQLMANQDAFSNFSTVSQYFPDKDRVNIRSRYNTLNKWMKKNPNMDISGAPRRGARRLGHGKTTEDLNRAIESLKRRLQTEVIEKKSSRVTKESPEYVIDDAIVAIITNENRRLMETKKVQSYQEEQEKNPIDVDCHNFNVSAIKKILILLKAKLNRQKFAHSPMRNIYQGLLDKDSGVHPLKVISYSKRDGVKNIKIEKKLDIWGKFTLGRLQYVFPPNYATITGCRKLMSYYITPKANNNEVRNINIIIKRNLLLKDQFNVLLERFNSLFLWPMLLSNISPDDCKLKFPDDKVVFKKGKTHPSFGKEDYYIALPKHNMFTKTQNAVNNEIDVEESNDSQTIDIDQKFFEPIE